MKSNFQMVKEFHETFKVQQLANPTFTKQELVDLLKRRFKMLDEEVNELEQAGIDVSTRCPGYVVEVIDALIDIIYVAYGTLDLLGVDADAAFAEVHQSNMSKLGDDGEPILNGINYPENPLAPFGKVMKGPYYREPNLHPFADVVLDNLLVSFKDIRRDSE